MLIRIKCMFMQFILFLLPLGIFAQEVEISGQVLDAVTGRGIAGVEIRLPTLTFFSDDEGNINFKANLAQSSEVVLSVFKTGFQETQVTINPKGRSRVSLGTIKLSSSEGKDGLSSEEFVPVVTLSVSELDNEGEQNVSGLLTASNDVFISATSFNFSSANFRIRGYDGQHNDVYFNGVQMNDLESGFPGWNLWSGLNDVIRSRTNTVGLAANPFGFGGIGGISSLDVRASRQREQLRVSYAASNRAYNNRVMATYSSGLLANGWAFSVSASRRWAQEGYVPGTFYDAYAYFLGVEKKLNDQHSIGLTILGSPVKRGRTAAATAEMYDLAGTNYYNPNWGYQQGEKRNARVQNTSQPMGVLRHDWQINNTTRLTTAVGYQIGRNGTTALDWYNARDPRPNYYRKLPSYIQNGQAADVEKLLRENENLRQIDWDNFYQVNRSNAVTVANANGIAGNTVTGNRSQYVVEERRFDRNLLSANSNFESSIGNTMRISGGLSYQYQEGKNFKVLNDLLGGDFYLDIDKFAEFSDLSGSDEFYQNNIEVPNRIVKKGDRFGYDYGIKHQRIGSWAQLELYFPKFDFFVGGSAAGVSFWRTGFLANGKFPDNSKGDSEHQNFLDWGSKAGFTYKIDGRNYLLLNAGYYSQAPILRNTFVSPRTRDQVVPGLTNEKIQTIEGGYILKSPYLKGRVIGYYTQLSNQNRVTSFYLDNAVSNPDGSTSGGFVNYVMSGIATRNAGLELGLEWAFSPGWKVSSAAALGQYLYTARPSISVYLDNAAEKLREDVSYLKGFYVPNMPQTAGTIGLSYNSPKFWFVNINLNYFDNIYIDVNPERRTTSAVSYVSNPDFIDQVVEPGSVLWKQIIEQERAPSAMTLDFFGGKSWKIDDIFLYLNVGVNNILDKQDFITGGFEQYRFDYEGKDVNKFPSNYFYSFGRNYYVSLAIRL